LKPLLRIAKDHIRPERKNISIASKMEWELRGTANVKERGILKHLWRHLERRKRRAESSGWNEKPEAFENHKDVHPGLTESCKKHDNIFGIRSHLACGVFLRPYLGRRN
jgi:hypothetical protein